MNSKAKQRAAATGIGRRMPLLAADVAMGDEIEPAPRPAAAASLESPVGVHRIDILPGDIGKRLDRFLAETFGAYPGLSRTRLQALVVGGSVRMGGDILRLPSAKIAGPGPLLIDIPEPVPATPRAEPIPLTIVYEDAHLLILDKPAGLVVHPAGGHEDGTLVNALLAHCGASLSGIGGVRRPGIVHRLDKDTTGLMVVAKSDAAHQGLADIFADHGRSGSLERCYTAFVWGTPPTSAGTIDRPLGRHATHRDKMRVVAAAYGRHAVTHWDILTDYGPASAIRCRLETGRTHQIRVHLTDLGHPLIGDPVYGVGFKTKASTLGPQAAVAAGRLKRQALHASTLGFEHPVTGEPLSFDSPLPPDLAALEAGLQADLA